MGEVSDQFVKYTAFLNPLKGLGGVWGDGHGGEGLLGVAVGRALVAELVVVFPKGILLVVPKLELTVVALVVVLPKLVVPNVELTVVALVVFTNGALLVVPTLELALVPLVVVLPNGILVVVPTLLESAVVVILPHGALELDGAVVTLDGADVYMVVDTNTVVVKKTGLHSVGSTIPDTQPKKKQWARTHKQFLHISIIIYEGNQRVDTRKIPSQLAYLSRIGPFILYIRRLGSHSSLPPLNLLNSRKGPWI